MGFGGYNDVSNHGHQKKKKKYAIIGISSILLVAMVAAVAVGVSRSGHDDSSNNNNQSGQVSTSMKAIQAICQPTDYKETCEKTLSSAAGNTTDPKELIKVAFQVAMREIKGAIANSTALKDLAKDSRTNQALENCKELLEYSIDDLTESFDKIGAFDVSKIDDYTEDLKVWLSGAITYEQTCLDGFENTTGDAGERMKAVLKTSQELTKNGLAMVNEISKFLSELQISGLNRRLLSEESEGEGEGEFPSWVHDGKRRLLAAAASAGNIKADVVIAKDGTGKYKTINESLKDIPKNNNKTFVIHVKAGIYQEYVVLDKHMTHVMVIGDGPTKTKITGNKNYIDGTPTFKTATFSKYYVYVIYHYFAFFPSLSLGY